MDHSHKFRIVVVGSGAVGSYFGAMLHRSGEDVTFVARPGQAKLLREPGLIFETEGRQETIKLQVTDDPGAAAGADLVLLCVKSYDTESAARSLAPHLSPKVCVLSLQNGVSNPDVFERVSGIPAVPAVVYVAAQMESPNHLLHKASGNLIIGVPHGSVPHGSKQQEAFSLGAVAELFKRASVPCSVSDHIEVDLWTKFIINCAYNGISACTQSEYGAMVEQRDICELMTQIATECTAVANALGVTIDLKQMNEATLELGHKMKRALSSTAQDLLRGKRTEIDAFNGHIAEIGRRVGVSVTANHAIYSLVKLIESRAKVTPDQR